MINLPPRYEKVLKEFTAGGMADTLLCEDAHLQRQVVIKSLKPGIEPHRLIDELAALSAIRSRYVVQVFDVIVESGNPVAFVEEFLPGSEIQPCAGGTTAHDALKVLYPIAAGIADIHAHQRVHRDIKPDNMRYDAEGQLKIFDFGLSKINAAPGTKVLYFTEGFTAPESFAKDSSGLHNFDYPLDVYSFGCVAIWLLNDGVIPPSMMGFAPVIPSDFDFASLAVKIAAPTAALLLKCLAPHPADRPTMALCKKHLADELLRDQHKMALTWSSNQAIVDRNTRSGTIRGNGSAIGVSYSGIAFEVSSVSGDVSINNAPAYVGQILTGSTVIVLRGVGRPLSVTCDVSHPEVML